VTSVANHYETLLAPIYLWMAGGIDDALASGKSDVSALLDAPGYAVDLGAGFGMHSIPLARSGFRVVAVDSSSYLLEQLRKYSTGLPVSAVHADLRDFSRHLSVPADLILCMGDTLAHLENTEEIEQLFRDVAASLRSGGRFVATFRDYRELALGDKHFILVRSDTHRIHTCLLEGMPERVVVHDIVHDYGNDGWSLKVSSYEKLRLTPEVMIRAAEGAGLSCRSGPGPRGMLMIEAHA
jgi:SAM-dependent methyltransferase